MWILIITNVLFTSSGSSLHTHSIDLKSAKACIDAATQYAKTAKDSGKFSAVVVCVKK